VATFSGPLAASGRHAENGLRLQVNALNAKGGVQGRQVHVVAADDEGDPAKAAELVREQLADAAVRLVVGPSSTESFKAVMGQYTRAQVPNCVGAVGDQAAAQAPFSFRTTLSASDRLTSLLEFLQKGRPEIRTVGLLEESNLAAEGANRQLTEQAGRYGLTYAGRASIRGSNADEGAALQQLMTAGAQAVVVSSSTATALRVSALLQPLGVEKKVQLLGLSGLDSYGFAAAAGDAAGGSIFAGTTQTYLTDLSPTRWPPRYREFVRGVTREYGYEGNGVEIQGSPVVADCVLQWSRAVQTAGTFGGPEVVRAWEKLDLPSGQTALGVPERGSPSDHTTLHGDSVFVYSWVKSGAGYRLKQLSGPGSG
jgi:branched-chain amino acid transport system substrate-binding protein